MSDAARTTRKFPWLILLVIALVIGGAAYAFRDRLPFVSSPVARWNSSTELAGRKEAAQELVNTQALLGKSRDEVLRDLGQPDRSDEATGSYEWKLGSEDKIGQDKNDRSVPVEETSYLTVRFLDGAAAVANITAYVVEKPK